jgi:hypothetical protein
VSNSDGVKTADSFLDESFAAFRRAAEAMESGSSLIGKYRKGRYKVGGEGDDLPLDTRVAVDLREASRGYIHWEGGKPVERKMYRMGGREMPPDRTALGLLDQDDWEIDPRNGKKKDPWSPTVEIPCREVDGEKRQIKLVGDSAGFRRAFKELCSATVRGMSDHPGQVPIIALGSGSFTKKGFGEIDRPVSSIVGWVSPEVVVEPEPEQDFDDAVPF